MKKVTRNVQNEQKRGSKSTPFLFVRRNEKIFKKVLTNEFLCDIIKTSQGADADLRKRSENGSPVQPKMKLPGGKQTVSDPVADQEREVPKNLAPGEVKYGGESPHIRFARYVFLFRKGNLFADFAEKCRKGLEIRTGIIYNYNNVYLNGLCENQKEFFYAESSDT